jgi:hypothetical protein
MFVEPAALQDELAAEIFDVSNRDPHGTHTSHRIAPRGTERLALVTLV